MRGTVRITAFFMGIVMLVMPLLSCNDPMKNAAGTTDTVDGAKDSVFEIVYPSVSVSAFKFTLNDRALGDFKDKLEYVKSLFNGEASEEQFKGALYGLLSDEAELQTQYNMSYLLYLRDTADPAAWDNYLYAYELYSSADGLFWEFYNEAAEKENGLASVLVDVVRREFGSLLEVDPSADSYAYDMEVYEGQYNSLVSANASEGEIFNVYKEYLGAAKGLAKASGDEDYYEYASEHMYFRDDSVFGRIKLRGYVKEYLVPLCRELKAVSSAYDSGLSGSELALSNKYLYSKYDSFDSNYLFDYFSSLRASTGNSMKEAFEKDRIIIGNLAASHNTAQVSFVGNTPVCYFHEDKTTLETMAHELGHYYEYSTSGMGCKERSYSLGETYSISSELLIFSYLSGKLDSAAIRSAELYALYNLIYQAISSVIKDEFDEYVFTCDPSSLTVRDLDAKMRALIDEYGVSDLSSGIVDQLVTYWRRIGLSYAMSNYCYAEAMITALQVYLISKDDYEGASEIYRRLVEESIAKDGFAQSITRAGLTTPYDKQTYINLGKLTEIYS
jgi:hypothetical protein